MSESIEFKYASKFGDVKKMSAMVALTAGASFAELGINK